MMPVTCIYKRESVYDGNNHDIHQAGHATGRRGGEGPGSEIADRGRACCTAGDCGAETLQGLDEEKPG